MPGQENQVSFFSLPATLPVAGGEEEVIGFLIPWLKPEAIH
jgi:hypothetical protein